MKVFSALKYNEVFNETSFLKWLPLLPPKVMQLNKLSSHKLLGEEQLDKSQPGENIKTLIRMM